MPKIKEIVKTEPMKEIPKKDKKPNLRKKTLI
jgi:hypothetical protein